jgi:hypothetical protein
MIRVQFNPFNPFNVIEDIMSALHESMIRNRWLLECDVEIDSCVFRRLPETESVVPATASCQRRWVKVV